MNTTTKAAAYAFGAALALILTGSGPLRAQDDEVSESKIEKAKAVAQDLIFRSVELDNRVRLREAVNSLRQTPEISAILARIASGKTDEEIRLARIEYYTALDKGLKKTLPDLKERISEMTRAALARLEFNNVRSNEEVAAELGAR